MFHPKKNHLCSWMNLQGIDLHIYVSLDIKLTTLIYILIAHTFVYLYKTLQV